MPQEYDAREKALRCLLHPSSLAAIIVLLWNDHYGKFAFASWWTGKLSDFAGLYFFPFLVIFLAASLFPRRSFPEKWGTGFIFAATAATFLLIKSFEAPNRLAREALSFILNEGVMVARDPGDIIALVVLIPAALLWRKTGGTGFAPSRPWARLLFPLVPAIAVLGCVATSIGGTSHVVGVRVSGGETYLISILVRHRRSASSNRKLEPEACRSLNRVNCSIYRGKDRGLAWRKIDKPSPELWKRLLAPPAKANRARRYSGTPGTGRVEYSDGKSRRTSWRIPSGRYYYMQRRGRNILFPFPPASMKLDPGPYEIARTPYGIIAAMGDQGILLKGEKGAWRRIGVGAARPTPFHDWNLERAFILFLVPEGLILFLVFLIAYAALTIAAMLPLRSRVPGPRPVGVPRSWIIVGGAGLVLATGMLIGPSIAKPLGLDFLDISIYFAPLIWLSLFFAAWLQAGRIRPGTTALHLRAWGASFLTPGLVWIFLYLWAAGIIPWYHAALITGVIMALLYFVRELRVMRARMNMGDLGPKAAPDSTPAP